MPLKKPGRKGTTRVTFSLPAGIAESSVALCGEFNDWDEITHPMKRYKDGHFAITVNLDDGHSYRYRYLLDGEVWENDWEAECYVPNDFGGDDSLVTV